MINFDEIMLEALEVLSEEEKDSVIREFYLMDEQNGLDFDVKVNGHISPIMWFYPDDTGAVKLLIHDTGRAEIQVYKQGEYRPCLLSSHINATSKEEFKMLAEVFGKAPVVQNQAGLFHWADVEAEIERRENLKAHERYVKERGKDFNKEHDYKYDSIQAYLTAYPERIIREWISRNENRTIEYKSADGKTQIVAEKNLYRPLPLMAGINEAEVFLNVLNKLR